MRWGALRALGEGVAIQTRSGNTTDPDATWSDWTPLADGKIVSPAGRYLQYRAILSDGGSLSRVEALYRAPNRAPRVEWTAPAGGEAFSGKKTLTWKGTDPDGDTLRYNVEIAGADGNFKAVDDPTPTDNKVEVDTAKLGDGLYRARVRASDASRNPGDPQSDSAISLPFTLDNTAPNFASLSLEKIAEGWRLGGVGTDETSPLAGAEWRIKPAEEKKADAKKPVVTDKADATATKADATKADATKTATIADAVADNVETGDDASDEDASEAAAKAKANANAKAAAKARSDWQAIGSVGGVFNGKTETLIAILDSAFAPAPLKSGMEIEVRLRDAAGNQTVKTLKLP